MTAKEKLLERAPHWTEEQAARALRAAESDLHDWGDVRAQAAALAEHAEARLRQRERAAGSSCSEPGSGQGLVRGDAGPPIVRKGICETDPSVS